MEHALQEPLPRFIVQVILIIVCARLVGLVVRRVGQPMVIAEIVAGIMLGPSVFGLVAPDAMTTLFPTAGMAQLGLMSQCGLVLFMFLVGLELDLGLLRGRGHTSVVISHSSIIVPFALGLLSSIYLHPRMVPDVPYWPFALFMGVAMSITAFPVLARILSERQILRTRLGTIAIACAAVDDITAWCILAFVVSTARAGGVVEAFWTTSLALVYVAAMLFVVRPLLQRVQSISGTGAAPSQNVVAAIFAALLLSAWTTEIIGVHALFGAFMFGAVMPKKGGFARALAEKLEDIVVVFMLPIFFAYSGLRTEIGLLDTTWEWLVCGFIILLACIGKFCGSAFPARWTGLRWRESFALGLLMNTRGLMELVVLNIGLDLGVISPTLFTMMVLMALFTTFLTTPVLELVYPAEEIRRELIRTHERTLEPVRGDRGTAMLLCLADEEPGPSMVDVTRAVLGDGAARGEVFALHLRDADERTSEMLEPGILPTLPIAGVEQRGRDVGLSIKPLSFVSADTARDICDVAEVKDVDLVLMGAHKPLLGHAVFGGVVHRVLESAGAHVCVLVGAPRRAERILVPFADGPHDRLAIELAQRLQVAWGAELTIFRVADDVDPAEAVVKEARSGYDLVVVGVGREWGTVPQRFALRTERLLEGSGPPLLVVRAGKDARPLAPAIADAPRSEGTGG